MLAVDPSRTALWRRQHDENRRYEIHIDVLQSQLSAAMQLMEHRERWWMTGLHNTESAFGREMDRVHASEVAAATSLEAQMTTLLGVLRAMQKRAESSSMAALSSSMAALKQQKLRAISMPTQRGSRKEDDDYQLRTETMESRCRGERKLNRGESLLWRIESKRAW